MAERLLLLVFAGCWTGGPPNVMRATACAIHERLVEPAGAAKLSIRGSRFAELVGPYVRLDVAVTGGTARARIETDEVDLEGDLDLESLPVRPKKLELHDGWIEVTHAIGRAALDDKLRLEVDLPAGMQPAWTSIDVPCDDLTTTAPPPAADTKDPWVTLPSGTTATLYRQPGNTPLRSWIAPKQPSEPMAARVIERRAGHLKVRIGERNAVIAWIEARAVRDLDEGDLYGGLIGDEVGVAWHPVRCSRAVTIHVQIDGRLVQVGRAKPDVVLKTRRTRTGDLELELGQAEGVVPVIRRADATACPGQSAP